MLVGHSDTARLVPNWPVRISLYLVWEHTVGREGRYRYYTVLWYWDVNVDT